jgi:hypothetical protein
VSGGVAKEELCQRCLAPCQKVFARAQTYQPESLGHDVFSERERALARLREASKRIVPASSFQWLNGAAIVMALVKLVEPDLANMFNLESLVRSKKLLTQRLKKVT